MPDLATVVPVFDVESIEHTAGDTVDRFSRRRVEFESVDFNKRFIATVPQDHDPVALRELFSPGFIDWITRIPAEVDFGITDQQLFFHWCLRERSKEELKDDYRVVWVVLADGDEATHLRLSGPREIVDQHYPAFEAWLKSLK